MMFDDRPLRISAETENLIRLAVTAVTVRRQFTEKSKQLFNDSTESGKEFQNFRTDKLLPHQLTVESEIITLIHERIIENIQDNLTDDALEIVI
ncbi:MAG: hypothetical protein J6K74_07875 [Marinifilaceae bacterium]|nr:hypothetical protein [Marinifilaceae bacterium]